jgi:hypothetical protein
VHRSCRLALSGARSESSRGFAWEPPFVRGYFGADSALGAALSISFSLLTPAYFLDLTFEGLQVPIISPAVVQERGVLQTPSSCRSVEGSFVQASLRRA